LFTVLAAVLAGGTIFGAWNANVKRGRVLQQQSGCSHKWRVHIIRTCLLCGKVEKMSKSGEWEGLEVDHGKKKDNKGRRSLRN